MTKILKIFTVFFVINGAGAISNDLFGQMRAAMKGGLNASNLYADKVSEEMQDFESIWDSMGRHCHLMFLSNQNCNLVT